MNLEKIYITNKDLKNGSYLINQPGQYILNENIIFHPNPDNDFQPTKDQYDKYNPSKGFILGFFAVFVIETTNVIFDLNGFTIQCSNEFLLKQRFCALIELASSPFIPKQGPADFGKSIISAKNCTIKNGCLGQVSHHGIHGNGMMNIKLIDLTFKDYEVAGISLNGGKNIIIENCHLEGNSVNVPTLSNYSHCKFDLPFLKKIVEKYPEKIIETWNKSFKLIEIYNQILKEVEIFEDAFIHTKPYDGIFKNKSGLYDGNVYGIVLNSLGVVVNDFKPLRNEETVGNENIKIINTIIKNVISDGKEVIGIFNNNNNDNLQAYGKSAFVGPVGDMFNLMESIDENGYFNNYIISLMQIIITKFGDTQKELGTANINSFIYNEWINSKKNIFGQITFDKNNDNKKYYLVLGSDSMNHKMKGNIGLFVSQGLDINIENIKIDNVINNGLSKSNKGSQSIGIGICGSVNINIKHQIINNIISLNGESNEIELINKNQNINFDI